MWPGLIQWPVRMMGVGGGGGQRTTLIILLSTTAEAPEMQTLLPHGNMMNFMALCLYEVSWTELIEVLKNSTGLGGNGLVCLRRRGPRVAALVSMTND